MRTIPEILANVAAVLHDCPLRDEVNAALATFTEATDIGRQLRLTATEQTILDTLATTGFATNKQLMTAVGVERETTLYVHRCRLNKKLKSRGLGEVNTRRGIGYTWERGDGNGA